MTAFLTRSPEQTQALAKKLLAQSKDTRIFLLHGNLGAGKTVFVKGLAKALGITEPVTSPTFTLRKSYTGRSGVRLHHFDLYRLQQNENLETIGLQELLEDGRDYLAVEWPEKMPKRIFSKIDKILNLYFENGAKENERKIGSSKD